MLDHITHTLFSHIHPSPLTSPQGFLFLFKPIDSICIMECGSCPAMWSAYQGSHYQRKLTPSPSSSSNSSSSAHKGLVHAITVAVNAHTLLPCCVLKAFSFDILPLALRFLCTLFLKDPWVLGGDRWDVPLRAGPTLHTHAYSHSLSNCHLQAAFLTRVERYAYLWV